MATKAILLLLLLFPAVAAENLEKTQKKELEAQVKTMTAEAQRLERAGQLAEARTEYAESQALIEVKDVTDAIKRLDEEIKKRVKDDLSGARKLYDSQKFKDAANQLDGALKLKAFQPILAYDLALCYYQLGDRNKALEYLGNAAIGTPDPKQKQKLMQLLTFFITGEKAASINDSDRDRVSRVNRLSESIGMEAYLEDSAGESDPDSGTESSSLNSLPPQRTRRLSRRARTAVPARVIDRVCAMSWPN